MPATYTTDVPAWIPAVISSTLYDLTLQMDHPLGRFATVIPDLAGGPGDRVSIPTANANTAATNLAENVAATDEKLSGGAVTVTVKEAVQSIAWSDRTRIQPNQDPNVLAGQRAANGMADRLELDLGAALLAGRNTAQDAYVGATSFTVAALRAMKRRIPAALRRRGVEVFTTDTNLEKLFDDPVFANAAAFPAAADVQSGGELTRPLFGISAIHVVDDTVLPNITVGANPAAPPVIMAVRGTLVQAIQKAPSVETERDARARLTRIVSTCLHAEGVADGRGIVATAVAP